ncbi:MAG TPA: AmmeMemoRadiSam system protein B [Magnetospirillum sp.]|nr:AmmeMemoRadiSam system protein B [Magnetospirillum sp.]
MTVLRPTAVAGMFYPAQADELARQIADFLAEAPRPAADAPVPKALIAPHAGYVYSGPVAARAYALLAPAKGRITRVVLMGPSHRVAFRGIATSGADAWATPLGNVPIDRDTVERLKSLPMVGELDKAHEAEHSLEVHVPFLQAVLGDVQLVPLVAGEAPRDVVAAVLGEAWGGPETLIVISTDLSHYLDYDACREADAATVAAIEHLDPAAIGSNQACGRVPVGGLLLAAQHKGMTIKTLDVRNSGDTAGPRDRVVGYGAWALYEPEDQLSSLGPTLLELAWGAIRARLSDHRIPVPAEPAALARPGACFVTLKRNGQLRGCIGSPQAWRPLGEDVVDNAVKAAFEDARFAPVSAGEVDELTLSVSILTPPVPMRFTNETDLLSQLRPHVDGLIIEDGGRRALFLPAVWDQLPDPAQFLAHLKHKAGMPIDHWSPHFRASRFQAVEVK